MLPLLGLFLLTATSLAYVVYQCFSSPLAKNPGLLVVRFTKFYGRQATIFKAL